MRVAAFTDEDNDPETFEAPPGGVPRAYLCERHGLETAELPRFVYSSGVAHSSSCSPFLP
jgi:hypothetical protein